MTDNPLLFVEQGDVLSGGNFHAEPVAFAADTLALALAEMGNLSERRMAVLIDPKMSGLPAFLVENSGAQFGVHDRAGDRRGSRVGEQDHGRSLQRGLHTNLGQPGRSRQHGHSRARRLGPMVDNAAASSGIELLAAAQGIDFHRPARSSASLETCMRIFAAKYAHYAADRFFAPDIEAAKQWVKSGRFSPLVQRLLPSPVSLPVDESSPALPLVRPCRRMLPGGPEPPRGTDRISPR